MLPSSLSPANAPACPTTLPLTFCNTAPPGRISSADIKDKTDLLEARKDIERRMERFKVCEKEAKTKAFSKEGLGAASRVDPKEKLKQDMRDWLSSIVDTLDTQVRRRCWGPGSCGMFGVGRG